MKKEQPLSNPNTNKEISPYLYQSAWEIRDQLWWKLSDSLTSLGNVNLQHDSNIKRHALTTIKTILDRLEPIENYWAFPGKIRFKLLKTLFLHQKYDEFLRTVQRIKTGIHKHSHKHSIDENSKHSSEQDSIEYSQETPSDLLYFEVLVIGTLSKQEELQLRKRLKNIKGSESAFRYEIVVVPTFEDALLAVLFNYTIQACVIHYRLPFYSEFDNGILSATLEHYDEHALARLSDRDRSYILGEKIAAIRPELDLFLISDISPEKIAGSLSSNFRRVFYREEDSHELHFSVLQEIDRRYQTPFFNALREYTQKPTGVFHALPVSRGKSVLQSDWIKDIVTFYGEGVFLAESSATSGGLDSLSEPTGPLKIAQELAARAFGAQRTFFVTNGTSTANKIVVQALIQPGDIVLLDRNCHKSHHYGMVLSGADTVYLDAYPLNGYSMYGAVPLREIKKTLLQFKKQGKLERVKLVLLTNCTFDGIVYDVERVMEECLAIKPDLVFLWDEAWFAFAAFHPLYRRRTGMGAASRLQEKWNTPAYLERYQEFKQHFGEPEDEETWLTTRLIPDPTHAKIRVYATQSTHKTLTAFRQGSMIHVHDQEFKSQAEEAFHEAYMTHTSTSPNYQILASLDIGRRQMELEGYALVQNQVNIAMALREEIAQHPLLKKYFRFLATGDLIPEDYRQSGIDSYFDSKTRWAQMKTCWENDEFVVDPSRLTLSIELTGIDGDTFKHDYLMTRHDIQVNKTTRNTVLFMTHIGTTRSAAAYLIEVLVKIARDLDQHHGKGVSKTHPLPNTSLPLQSNTLPPLPDFSAFHSFFRKDTNTPEGDIRRAYYMAYNQEFSQHITLAELKRKIAWGEHMVSAMFVIPYPPGFPILVPGQVISEDILLFMEALNTREIHGYKPDQGFKVFTRTALGEEAFTAGKVIPLNNHGKKNETNHFALAV